jgi:predicted dehydrogenase
MTAPREIGIAVVGGGTMARAHAYGYAAAPVTWPLPGAPRLAVLCGRSAARTAQAARDLGFADSTTDWRQAVERPDVDIVDICTPPGAHAEVVAAAAAAGKAVICEKPLSTTLADGRAAVAAVRAAGVLNAIGFNYRRLPAIALMRQMIGDGRIGTPRLWRGSWLSDEFCDPGTPFDWRFDRALGGSTIADLGSHLVDLAEWMTGPVTGVTAQSQTFTATRARADGAPAAVTVDDASSALLEFAGGLRGTLEVAKTCPRRPCDFTLEVNGSDGTLIFDYARLNELWLGRSAGPRDEYGMTRIRAEDPGHPYAAHGWPIGQGAGYGASFVHQAGELLAAWPDGPWEPDLATGLRVQEVCTAIETSARQRRWCPVPAPGAVPAAASTGAGNSGAGITGPARHQGEQ